MLRIVRFRHRTPALVGSRQAMGFVRTERSKPYFSREEDSMSLAG